jgi:hypothetical protein
LNEIGMPRIKAKVASLDDLRALRHNRRAAGTIRSGSDGWQQSVKVLRAVLPNNAI